MPLMEMDFSATVCSHAYTFMTKLFRTSEPSDVQKRKWKVNTKSSNDNIFTLIPSFVVL